MSFNNLTIQSEVKSFAIQNYQHAFKTFKKFGIDFCCGGSKPLEVACSQRGLDPDEVYEQLNQPPVYKALPSEKNWESLSLQELVENIVVKHHIHMRKILPELTQVMKKVLNAHGKNYPALFEVSKTLQAIRDDLEPHMMKEEAILFPMIQKLDKEGSLQKKIIKQIGNPIRKMTDDHKDLGKLLETMRKLTNHYSVPDNSCATFEYLYKELEALENDLLIHTHKENNILFPKVLEKQSMAIDASR